MKNLWISPNYPPEKLSSGNLEDKIDVFEDRLRVAIINQAVALFNKSNSDHKHAGNAVLMILLPYFETITQYRQGRDSNNKSKRFFREEFLRAFSIVNATNPHVPLSEERKEKIANEIYVQVRCGLLHSWASNSKVMLSNRRSEPFWFAMNGNNVALVEIHPEEFLKKINEELFPAFLNELRNPANKKLRSNFEKYFDQHS